MTTKLLVVDLHGVAHRLYWSVPQMQIDGKEMGLVFAVAKTILDLIRTEEPEFMAICADAPGRKWRHDIYPEYKANRKPSPQPLKDQLLLLPKLIHDLGFTCLVKERFEADDIIAEICTSRSFENCQKIIISSDKDLMQLVGDRTVQLDPSTGKLYDRASVTEKFGFGPYWIAEYLSLVGDSSDNVPGVSGIGEVAAKRIILGHPNGKDLDRLSWGKEDRAISRVLVTLPGNARPNLGLTLSNLFCDFSSKITSALSSWGFPALAKEAESIGESWL